MPRPAKAKPNRHRGPGEGSIILLPDGRAKAVMSITRPDGTKGRKSFTAPTKREAAARMKAYKDAAAKGQHTDDRLTVADYVTRWLTTRAPARGSAKRAANDLARLTPFIGGVLLRELGPAPIQTALARLADAGYAPGTIRLSRTALSTMLGDARRDRLIATNPVPDTTPPRVPRKPPPTFTAAQVAHILDTAQATGDPHWPLWTVMLTTGLRMGEVLGLRWQDIDLAAGLLTVDGQVVRSDGKPRRVAFAKNTTSHRTLPLPARTVRALAAQQATTGAGELVFPSATGAATNAGTVRRRYYAMLTRAGIARTVPHGGRHTAASLLLAEGVGIKVVSDILGHANITTTANTYIHLTRNSLTEAMDRLDRALSGPVVVSDVAGEPDAGAEQGA